MSSRQTLIVRREILHFFSVLFTMFDLKQK